MKAIGKSVDRIKCDVFVEVGMFYSNDSSLHQQTAYLCLVLNGYAFVSSKMRNWNILKCIKVNRCSFGLNETYLNRTK